ncbi:lycopene cyclase family protein [Microcella humidisoli]|uniref:Lycopene cyclase family protein n=1 Tax=Microcella humidisoli TaxID=2963406 RepID=A0ABY5FYW9_9MICO|nr:lycopene cyclase family protein [Microcella humidisoli]UTT63522.1 lycopene cyclase family protein [Microcella humidisoli]
MTALPPESEFDLVDLVILGAGCAGLSLAARLASGDGDLSVVLVDTRTEFADDRSWSFWQHDHHPLRDIVAHEWSGWTYADLAGRSATHRVPGMSYQYIRGVDFYRWALAEIAGDERIDLRLGVAARDLSSVTLADGSSGVRVTTDEGALIARRVVDTRPRRTAALLYQCFSGVEVEHGGALATEADAVGLMTRMRSGADGLGFVYVLPLSPTRALVEWTRFSPVPLAESVVVAERDAELAALGLAGATVVREEGGILPMGRMPLDEQPMPGVVLAGNAGGALRDASGYAFLRIQQWARACAGALARGEDPAPHPAEPWVRRQMDRIFLQALRAHPERTADYFMAMARGVAPHRLLRFLTDRATAGDLASIIVSLPLLPFLAQLPDRRARLVAAASAARADRVAR